MTVQIGSNLHTLIKCLICPSYCARQCEEDTKERIQLFCEWSLQSKSDNWAYKYIFVGGINTECIFISKDNALYFTEANIGKEMNQEVMENSINAIGKDATDKE